MDGWRDGWMDGWKDGWMNGWMDGSMDGWIKTINMDILKLLTRTPVNLKLYFIFKSINTDTIQLLTRTLQLNIKECVHVKRYNSLQGHY